MQLTPQSGNSAPTDLIPNGALLWAVVSFRGMKRSQDSGGAYGDLEFTIYEGQPFERRKVWDIVGDPDDPANSEAWRNMGMVALTRMLESAGGVDPKNPESYNAFNGRSCEEILRMLDGRAVAIRVKVEKGKDGYADKNKVGEYLTPNDQSSGHKNFTKLANGDHGLSQAKPPGIGGPQPGGFGFGRPAPAQNGQQTNGNGGQEQRPFGQQETQTTSPSRPAFNPNSGPSWLNNGQAR